MMLHLKGRTMMRMSMKMVVLGQTVRLLPIIGEADKEATHLSTCSTCTLLTRGRDEIDKKNIYWHLFCNFYHVSCMSVCAVLAVPFLKQNRYEKEIYADQSSLFGQFLLKLFKSPLLLSCKWPTYEGIWPIFTWWMVSAWTAAVQLSAIVAIAHCTYIQSSACPFIAVKSHAFILTWYFVGCKTPFADVVRRITGIFQISKFKPSEADGRLLLSHFGKKKLLQSRIPQKGALGYFMFFATNGNCSLNTNSVQF